MSVDSEQGRETVGGWLYALAAFGLWAVLPVYFKAVASVSVWEILAHRIVWCLLLLLLVVVVSQRKGKPNSSRWEALRSCFSNRRVFRLLLLGAVLLATNWCVFIYGATNQQILQCSLGYFLNPLVSVLLGLLVLKEKLRGLQWVALGIATAGLVFQVQAVGVLPWIALTLAGSFGLYGLLRKLAGVDGLVGLTAEMVLLSPIALACLLTWQIQGTGTFGTHTLVLDGLLLASGLVTAVPLFCFGQAVQNLRLSTLGFLQYLAPSGQLLLAVLVFGEPFTFSQQLSFALIWGALALFTLDTFLARRSRMVAWASPQSDPSPNENLVIGSKDLEGCFQPIKND